MSIQEIVMGASSSRPTNVVDKGIDLAPSPNSPLSAPTTNSDMIARDIPTADGTMLRKVGPNLRVPLLIGYELTPKVPRYILESWFTLLNVLRIVYRF